MTKLGRMSKETMQVHSLAAKEKGTVIISNI